MKSQNTWKQKAKYIEIVTQLHLSTYNSEYIKTVGPNKLLLSELGEKS